MSDREWECLKLVTEGLTYKEITVRLDCKYSTVRSHLHNAYKLLGAANASQATIIMISSGWLAPVNTDWEETGVTPAQRLYLDAFDDFLRASGRDAVLARGRMAHHLTSMFMEKGLPTPDT